MRLKADEPRQKPKESAANLEARPAATRGPAAAWA